MSDKLGVTQTIDLGDGKVIEIETGKLAKQANGSVVLKMGNTMILATCVASPEGKEGADFLPLTVDYQEKFASVGRIPGGFLKREARLSDYEILISRLVDRAVRPLFADDYHADTQLALSLISSDQNIMPDALAALAASAAITITDLPFNGPMSEVRVGRVDGKLVINPYKDELENSDIDMIVAGTMKDINMVEGEMNEISEADMVEALKFAHEAIKKQCQAQLDLCEKLGGKKPTLEYEHETHDEDLKKNIHAATYDKVYAVAKQQLAKKERGKAFGEIFDEFIQSLGEEVEDETKTLAKIYFKGVQYEAMRSMVLNEKVRLDGRKLNEVRPIWTEVDYLPSAHGSAVFTRGETQSLTSVTLGSKLDEQMLDSPMNSGYNRFLLHYNFPGFSTGEVKPNRGPARREVGHGNLAMRGIKKILPNEEDNPYVIRVVSDILESNGSSSMATVCAGCMALMDAGIKVKRMVSGIAMGLISDDKSDNYTILSDILGDEDHLGDMDFKVVGSEAGITAVQMDIKIDGLRWEIVEEALNQAKEGRLHILNEMRKTISEPATDYKPHTPRIERIEVDGEFIGAIIGPGGKMIQGIQKETGTTISITEVDEKGIVEIASNDGDSMAAAKKIIEGIIAVPEVGEVYEGKVKTITDFGAFIEFLPGKDGLLHISEINWKKLPSMEGVFEDGEEVKVKLIEIDKRTGKYRLSRKVLLPKPEGMPEEEEDSRPPRREGNNNRGRDNRGRDNRNNNRGGRDNRRDNRNGGNRENRSGNGNSNSATNDAYNFDDM
ncbi:MAG: polyribonucleotide nucleotidyltransferase [bacterium]